MREFLSALKTYWWPSAAVCSMVGLLSIWHIPHFNSQFYVKAKYVVDLLGRNFLPAFTAVLRLKSKTNNNNTIQYLFIIKQYTFGTNFRFCLLSQMTIDMFQSSSIQFRSSFHRMWPTELYLLPYLYLQEQDSRCIKKIS